MFRPNIEKLQQKRDVDGLLIALQYKRDPTIRKKAVKVLSQIGNERAGESLLQVLNEDEDTSVRAVAAKALKKLAPSSYAKYLIAKKKWNEIFKIGVPAIDPLIETLKHLDPMKEQGRVVLEKTPNVLAEIGLPTVGALIHALSLSEYQWARTGAAMALGQIGDAGAVEPLLHVLKRDQFPLAQVAAATALGLIGDTRAVEPLARELNNVHLEVQIVSARALGRIGDQRALKPLKEASDYKDPNLRATVLNAIRKVRPSLKSKNE